VAEGYEELFNKTSHALLYVYENHFDDADWFLKADDDT
jgi:glycoprotein-N-acetylgalactosamine 3-beta-galactosyltransferase